MFGSRLIALFVDMDAYFAQVEQRARPELRGVPIGIVPVIADTTCCIAASYEAKRCGVKGGMAVRDARKLCPKIRLVVSRPELYIRVHHMVCEAVDTCIPIGRVMSIDEMVCRLASNEREPEVATAIARRIKAAVLKKTGLTCSVGVAPNETLAKVASAMDKPDGLVVLRADELPDRLFELNLDDLPGVGRKMLERLHAKQVFTMEQLCALSEAKLVEIWKSIEGQRWWRRLRGYEVPAVVTRRRSIGHQRILAPKLRTSALARSVLIHLICKAAARMRREGYFAQRMMVGVRCMDHSRWGHTTLLEPTQDTLTLVRAFTVAWPGELPAPPIFVDVTLQELLPGARAAAPLFTGERRDLELWKTIDRINTKHGKQAVHLASMHDSLDAVPIRIPFGSVPDLDLPA